MHKGGSIDHGSKHTYTPKIGGLRNKLPPLLKVKK
jgi:hypothetical protein